MHLTTRFTLKSAVFETILLDTVIHLQVTCLVSLTLRTYKPIVVSRCTEL